MCAGEDGFKSGGATVPCSWTGVDPKSKDLHGGAKVGDTERVGRRTEEKDVLRRTLGASGGRRVG